MKNNGKTTVIFVLFLALAGCVSTDPMILRAFQFDRKAWNEDRRADLDPELVKARNAAFDAHERYARGSKNDAAKIEETPPR